MKTIISTACLALCAMASTAQVVSNTSFFVSEGAVVSIGQNFENKGEFINNGEVHVQRDFENQGSINSQGTVIFDGYEKQNLKGTEAIELAKVEIANDVDVQNTLVVSNEIAFNQGILASTEESQVVFTEGAKHFGASDMSHIKGSIKKINASDFEFPLGDGSMYRAFTANGENGTLTASYVAQNPFELSASFNKGVDYINEYEYWTLKGETDRQEAQVTIADVNAYDEGIAYLTRGSWVMNDGNRFNQNQGLNHGLIFTSGKGRLVKKQIGIWPNPTQGQFNLKLTGMDDNDEIMVDITNADGRVVLRTEGLVKDLRKVYELPVSLVTTELTVRVLNGDERLSEKLLLNR